MLKYYSKSVLSVYAKLTERINKFIESIMSPIKNTKF